MIILFVLKYALLKTSNQTIFTKEYVRKAVLFWTRNPKVPFRIWIFVAQEDVPLYPLSVEEIQSLMFDVQQDYRSERRSKWKVKTVISMQRSEFRGVDTTLPSQ